MQQKQAIKIFHILILQVFNAKTNLAYLKTEVDKLDIEKLVPVPVDLSKLSDVVKIDVVKKDVYDKLVVKVNSIDTSVFVLKTKYDTDKSESENKISDTSSLVRKTYYDPKVSEIEGKIPDVTNLATKTVLTTVTNLATKTVLTTVQNKIPDISSLAKKTDYDTKVTEIEINLNNHNHDKYIDTQEFSKLAADVINARRAQAKLTTKTIMMINYRILTEKLLQIKKKHVLVENKFKKLKTFDPSYFIGKNYFEEDGAQNYLVFQPISRYLTINGIYILSWKSKGLFGETITPNTISDYSLTLILIIIAPE